MRGTRGARREEEEEESVFISMTDLTVGFLFIIIILLIFFASQFSPDRDEKKVPLVRLQVAIEERDAARKERDEARASVATLTREKAAVEARAEALEQERDALLRRIAALEAQLREITEDRNALRVRLDASEAERRRLEEELAAARARLEELQEEIDALRAVQGDELETYFAQVESRRLNLLRLLRERIVQQFPEMEDIVTVENGALRFQSDQGLFDKGGRTVRADRRALVDAIARTLDEVLPCFTLGPRSAWAARCNPEYAMIDTVQIEGHTDSDGADEFNARLAADRALDTYVRMLTATDDGAARLLDHRNLEEKPVLAVAAYGENRPIRPNDSSENKSANRRIDLRFIMVAPPSVRDIREIRSALSGGGR